MAEFDASGFSAVNEFFGSDAKDGEDEVSMIQKNSEPPVQKKHKTKRGGVGSTDDQKEKNDDHKRSELSKRLLRVGRKPLRRSEEYDDEDDGELNPAVDQFSDDEEDAGRTGIAATKKVETEIQTSQSTGESKKIGKKERNRQKKLMDTAKEVDASANITLEEPAEENEVKPSEKKRKRKKVRSKQKNIRKDTRSEGEKPRHLVLGKSNYRGRPLTEETRKKLNLPTKAPGPKNHFVVEFSTKTEEAPKLAIEEFLDDEKPNGPIAKGPACKKRKTKYKNLM